MSNKLDSKFYVNSKDEGSDVFINREKTLLLVIDEQPRLLITMENGDKTLDYTLALIKAFNEYNMHVIATEQYPKGLGPLDDRIIGALGEDKIFDKTLFDAAIPEVMDYIKNNDIKNVLLVGAEGHVCVYQTARSLLNEGLNVFMVVDAISSFSEKLKDTAMDTLRDMGAVLISTESVLFDIARDSKDEHFKFISKLVKEVRENANEE